ncbi:hypothetical protein [Streptomyces sp. RKAG290]|uniref:hypothetical protein n=1 Tax=Streptomyces sp. RKAG290 TaxID=2888348 RepID=UPI00203322F3|nr:hypothetical protein [Streptomyces sp. RKAG290]MCM2413121.1 hypothetical protein [Streptomyces sp. RKAG290]
MTEGTVLAERIADQRAGVGDPRALLGELRRALVLVPLDGGGLWTAESGGVRWVCGFTDEAALARFAQARSSLDAGGGTGHTADAGRPWEFAELRGARLLDEIVPAMGVPAGVAVNIADPDGSMLFPPVTGIVPDAAAVDRVDADAPAVAPAHSEGQGR